MALQSDILFNTLSFIFEVGVKLLKQHVEQLLHALKEIVVHLA